MKWRGRVDLGDGRTGDRVRYGLLADRGHCRRAGSASLHRRPTGRETVARALA